MSAFLICWVAVLVKAGWLPRIGKLHDTSYSLSYPTGSWIVRMEGRDAYPWTGFAGLPSSQLSAELESRWGKSAAERI